jgi:hypothetical protein
MVCFYIDPCQLYSPEHEAKVERAVRSHRGAADPTARPWDSVAELQAATDTAVANLATRRPCPATGTWVADAWQAEKAGPAPLPRLPQPFDHVANRRVGADGLVNFEGRLYSVPFAYLGRAVEIRSGAGTVQVLADQALVAEHPRGTVQRLLIDPALRRSGHGPGPGAGTTGPHGPAPGRPDRHAGRAPAAGPVCRAGRDDPTSKCTLNVDGPRTRLNALRLAYAAEQLEPVLSDAVTHLHALHLVLDRMLDVEHTALEGRRVRTSLRLTSLTSGSTLADFDFAFQPAIERTRIETLAAGAWIRSAETLLIQGSPGVG